ncbi:MAG: hydantoinase B/oxoprolinase family protein [Thermosphaera sp.]
MNALDPVSLQIMWSRLINISEECWITIWRTAFSTIIGEAQDFGCELLDANGESLAHSPRSMPIFNLTLPRAVRALLEAFPAETLSEGDVLITNDPWLAAGHLFDMTLVTPVFRHDRLVGLIGSIGHCSDIGGTQNSLAVREIYEEGLQIPPMKLYHAGSPNSDLISLIKKNVRKGEMVIGDIYAQYSANQVGARRLLRFMEEYELDDLAGLAAVIQDRTEQAMREAITAIPDGEYAHSVGFDGVDEPLALSVNVKVKGDELTVAWEAPPQVERGGINCTLNYTAAHSVYALKSMLTPDIPSNAGCFRPIGVMAPEGSILNCSYPASVNLRTMTGWYCAPALFGALAPVLPERVQAFTGLPMGAGAYGQESDGRTFNDHLFQGGGQGASAHGDGKSALLYPTSAANTSVEMFEARTPLLVECKSLLPDSGGAGRHRGGLGQRVRVRKLYSDGRPVLLSLHPQGMIVATPGLFGGLPGRLANVALDNGQVMIEGKALGGLVELRDRTELVTIDMAGGSGYGNPLERPLAMLQTDLDEGFVTPGGLNLYGCELSDDGKISRGA